MVTFESDYTTGAHPKVLEKLVSTNTEQLSGYGNDRYCKAAISKIRDACRCPDADIWFISGGTQTNQLVISTMLENYEGVISAATGHVNVHEAGAIEYTGHKVIEIPQKLGKICAEDLKKYISGFYADGNYESFVFPGMVYISHPTEYGTLYTYSELESISAVCRKFNIPLFMDGARLAYALGANDTDVTLADIAEFCDVFYIGGTKCGALCGEAVVFTKNNTPKHFYSQIKQHGALLAKGRLMGCQFDALFTDGLYFEIGRHAIEMAERIKKIFAEKGYEFFLESPTNQQFIVIDNEKMEALKKKIGFGFWENYDDTHTVVRFATSWSTTDEDIKYLEAALNGDPQ